MGILINLLKKYEFPTATTSSTAPKKQTTIFPLYFRLKVTQERMEMDILSIIQMITLSLLIMVMNTKFSIKFIKFMDQVIQASVKYISLSPVKR